MATTATLTVPGRYYRRTVHNRPGCYFMRPKTTRRMNPRAFVQRLVIRQDALAGYWSQFLKAHPDAVLMVRYHRGISTLNSERWEHKAVILVPPDLILRQVKCRPGYTHEATTNNQPTQEA